MVMRSKFILSLLLLLVTLPGYGGRCPSYTVRGEYLYLLPCQAGMNYAIVGEQPSLTGNLRSVQHTFEWESAGRVELIAPLPCSCFDFSFQWTGLYASNTDSVTGPFILANAFFDVSADALVGGTDINGAFPTSTWDIDFTMFDLNLWYDLVCCRGVLLRTAFGVKGGWIKQKQSMTYINFFDFGAGSTASGFLVETNDFYGAGPHLGVEARAPLICGVNLAAEVDTALLIGKLQSPSHYTLEPTGSPNLDFRTHATVCNALPHLRMRLGLDRSMCTASCFTLDLSVGYEAQYFFNTFANANSLAGTTLATNVGYGNLLLQGFTLGCGVHF